jgi:fucose permease
MATLLLIIIYIAFISLGLPDSILGSAWPIIHMDFNVSISSAGIATMIISGGTIISSFFSEKLIRRYGTGKVTAVSVFMTAAGLLGINLVPGFVWLCLLGIPLGLGAGAVDSALNNFVANNYEAKHMNWLHCFWGVGATSGPLIMSILIEKESGWRAGYATIGIIQMFLVFCLIISLPLWKRYEKNNEEKILIKNEVSLKNLVGLKGAKSAFIGFLCYTAVELTTGLWSSSFLVTSKGISPEKVAKWVSLYYMGITIGRLISGFLAMKVNNKNMIRIGQILALSGTCLLLLPIQSVVQMIGLMMIGLGCAPIYPAMLHDTPNRFGKEMSQGIMGIQMAVAYVGSTFVPPLFGLFAGFVGFQWLPIFLMILIGIMIIASESLNKTMKRDHI